jgi:acetyl esterase/lipase
MPTTISRAAQAWLAIYHGKSWGEIGQKLVTKQEPVDGVAAPLTLSEFRFAANKMFAHSYEQSKVHFPVHIESGLLGGVDVLIVTPTNGVLEKHRDRVLINTAGNGFVLPIENPLEAAPIANMMRMKVVVVRPRLAPEHPFPAAVDDTISVMQALSERYDASRIGLFGSSSGGLLGAQVTAKLLQAGLKPPKAFAMLSSSGDMYTIGDTHYTNSDLDQSSSLFSSVQLKPFYYTGSTSLTDPILSPIHSDLSRFPATLIVSGTRDHLLSGSVLMHRALRRAGVKADLHVFEAMPHAHWFFGFLPEAKETHQVVADFFDSELDS